MPLPFLNPLKRRKFGCEKANEAVSAQPFPKLPLAWLTEHRIMLLLNRFSQSSPCNENVEATHTTCTPARLTSYFAMPGAVGGGLSATGALQTR